MHGMGLMLNPRIAYLQILHMTFRVHASQHSEQRPYVAPARGRLVVRDGDVAQAQVSILHAVLHRVHIQVGQVVTAGHLHLAHVSLLPAPSGQSA